jgi:hypothetical protein
MNDDYFVFYGERFYPSGGWKDFSAAFKSLEEAVEYIEAIDPCCAWAHVMHKGKVVVDVIEVSNIYEGSKWKFEDPDD